ncbi:hypothetical protein ABE237_00735 [Brevibacillus formosus]|uniref:hypothetical protein n=1 Tax=Brevibacillus formosus TaxID=54913 RepID=UPI0018CDA165|nr:hypothetical protein [Brevibacillus formosus]MBG9944674.1 hypothetical protein [Brevibacillus formosus]
MAKKLRVTMPDGSKWDVPADLIAKNRAEYYSKRSSDTIYEEEVEFALSDNYELFDWAENNMNWKDVRQFAVEVKAPDEPDYQEGWVNGDKEVVEC